MSNLKNKCQFFLHGHKPVSPKNYFSQMLEFVPDSQDNDFYGVGESLQKFEYEIAQTFGQEDCIFIPSGTMAQLMAMRVWCDQAKNRHIAFHPLCHLQVHEHLSYKKLHALEAELIGDENSVLTLEELKKMKTRPSVVLLELPQREIGGQLPEWEELIKQIQYLRSQGIKVHLDGARIWEVAPYYQKTYQQIGEVFDSIYISFYKGIGAISGAALLGSRDFIDESRPWLRRHGGNLITSYPIYLNAQSNLNKRIHFFAQYYSRTLEIADIISRINGVRINPAHPQVNMFHLHIKGKREDLVAKGLEISEKYLVWGLDHWKDREDGYCSLEVYIGDGALEISDELISSIIKQFVS